MSSEQTEEKEKKKVEKLRRKCHRCGGFSRRVILIKSSSLLGNKLLGYMPALFEIAVTRDTGSETRSRIHMIGN